MQKLKIIVFLFFSLYFHGTLKAETWNEPWQKEIIQNAEYFVLAKVVQLDSLGVHIEVLKNFGSEKTANTIVINGFSMLRLGSASGHGVHFDFEKDQTLYFLLNQKKDGNYAIPTPTSGYANLDDENNVYATYRHSYHQALIPQEIYEMTYQAIWNYYKGVEYDKNTVMKFIENQINTAPAGFEEEEINTFFLQHVALETAYLLDIPIDFTRLKKFAESENFHSRVSTVQLLSLLKEETVNEFLWNFILNEKHTDFEKVIAIWSLKKINDKTYLEKLKQIANELSDEETGFGGNIMDPRVGTHFPSPREAALKD